jgi:hypothetical protein
VSLRISSRIGKQGEDPSERSQFQEEMTFQESERRSWRIVTYSETIHALPEDAEYVELPSSKLSSVSPKLNRSK